MTDRPADKAASTTTTDAGTSRGKVPGRGDYKGLYRNDPPALTNAEAGGVLPLVSTGLADLLGGIDGTDHGRRRVYDLGDEPVELGSVCILADLATIARNAADDAADSAVGDADEAAADYADGQDDDRGCMTFLDPDTHDAGLLDLAVSAEKSAAETAYEDAEGLEL